MRFRFSSRLVWCIAFFAMGALPCLGGEVAVLKNGFAIKHERREIVGDLTRLYVSADGASFIDVPTAEIEHFEAAPEDPAPQPSEEGIKGTGVRGRVNAVSVPLTPNINISDVVNETSERYRLDPDLVNSVIKAESDFKVRAVSPKGAQGLMQLMPGTASQLGVPNAFDPAANVDGGAKYLRELLERYNFDLVKALAAYNAGPQRVEKYGGVPPYYETRAYVARIVKDFNKKKIAKGQATGTQTAAQNKASQTKTSVAAKRTAKTGAGTTVAASSH